MSKLYPQETVITANMFLNNFHSVWPIGAHNVAPCVLRRTPLSS